MMAALAEGTFAEAAQYWTQAQQRQGALGDNRVVVCYNDAADALVSAGKCTSAIVSTNGLPYDQYVTPSTRTILHEKLARQCILALKYLTTAEYEHQTIAVTICRLLARGQHQSDPHFAAEDFESLCAALNDACFLSLQLRNPRTRATTSDAVADRARWWIGSMRLCGLGCVQMLRTGCLYYETECTLLKEAFHAADVVRKFVYKTPVSVETLSVLSDPTQELQDTGRCLHYQIACERILQALRAYQQGCVAESMIWARATVRWELPESARNEMVTSVGDMRRRYMSDQFALRAKQMMKSQEDVDKLGTFALHVGEEAPHLGASLQDMKFIVRAAQNSAVQIGHTYRHMKHSKPFALHAYASERFQNAVDYMEANLRHGSTDFSFALLARLADQSARCFAHAADALAAVSDRAVREDLVNLHKLAADLFETNAYTITLDVKDLYLLSSDEALTVAEKAGQRYASAARARAQGDLVLYSDWLTAAQATAAFVTDLRARRRNKRRTRIFTEAYSPEALARADALAAVAMETEKAHFTCVDLCAAESASENGTH
jgi:hypothetical protein